MPGATTRKPKPGLLSVKRRIVKSGVFKAELDEFFKRELAEDGYSGVQIHESGKATEVIILATKTQNVLGPSCRRIRELNSLIEKRYGFAPGVVRLFAEKVAFRGLSAVAQAESLRYKLTYGLPVRKACYGILRFIMESGAKGAEVIVSGKIKGQRAKSMKFCDGLMIHSGNPVNQFVDKAVRHVQLPQGVLGIKVKIMLNHDSTGKQGPRKPLPDHVTILSVKEDNPPQQPYSENLMNN